MNLIRYDAARTALQAARSVDDVKDIRDKAEALRAYARQRGDVDMERWVAEIKLRACVRIGELSLELETSKGGSNPKSTLPVNGKSKSEVLKSAGISTSAAQRYEKLAEQPEKVERYIAEKTASGKPVTINEALALKPHVSSNSGENEWYTPAYILDAARKAMGGIDCDPASSASANKNVDAELYFTASENGLVNKWRGRVWLNPPYAQPLCSQFCEAVTNKFLEKEIEQACILVNNATETAWFAAMHRASTSVCFLEGRVKYLDKSGAPSGSPLQGQAVLYFGKRLSSFASSFGALGRVTVLHE